MKLQLFKLRNWVKNLYLSLFFVERIGTETFVESGVKFSNETAFSKKGIIIGDNVTIRSGTHIVTKPLSNGKGVTIGDNSVINIGCYIGGQDVHIGKDVLIGVMVSITSGFHNSSNRNKLIREQGDGFKKISIGNNVWIGTHATILGGVNIGEGSIIGAGALVNKNIPPYSIAVGVPARVIRKR